MNPLETRYQLYGDLNKRLNAIRQRMNDEVSDPLLKKVNEELSAHQMLDEIREKLRKGDRKVI